MNVVLGAVAILAGLAALIWPRAMATFEVRWREAVRRLLIRRHETIPVEETQSAIDSIQPFARLIGAAALVVGVGMLGSELGLF